MGLIDKFLDAIKLNDDYDEYDDDFLDEELDESVADDSFKDEKPKNRFSKLFGNKNDDEEDLIEIEKEKPVKKSSDDFNVTPKETKTAKKERTVRKQPKTTSRKKGYAPMEVNVIKPDNMEDAREIAETLLDECTVVLNLEGLDVDLAQRIIDFTCGACYSLSGSIQRISSYIFILTPANVDISGDYQEILSGAFDIPAMRSQY